MSQDRREEQPLKGQHDVSAAQEVQLKYIRSGFARQKLSGRFGVGAELTLPSPLVSAPPPSLSASCTHCMTSPPASLCAVSFVQLPSLFLQEISSDLAALHPFPRLEQTGRLEELLTRCHPKAPQQCYTIFL